MKFDKLKPNLQELNLNGVKKAASRVAHVRIRLSRGQWIGVIAGLVVVTVLLVILLRPRPAAVVLPFFCTPSLSPFRDFSRPLHA